MRSRHFRFCGAFRLVVFVTVSIVLAEAAWAVTINYSLMDYLHQDIEPTLPTITTLNPDIPSGGPVLTTDPSDGFKNAMTNSLASNDWWGPTINSFNWVGDLTGIFWVDVYRAGANNGWGYAQLLIRYDRGTGDPAADSLFWIQTVNTSLRGNNVPGTEVIPYADIYASSYPNGAKLPFYFRPDELVLDTNPYVGQANIRSSSYTIGGNTYNYDIAFWDQPSRGVTSYWQGELFLASYDALNKSVVIYDGVDWGFNVVPEPASLGMLALGSLFILRRIRPERKQA